MYHSSRFTLVEGTVLDLLQDSQGNTKSPNRGNFVLLTGTIIPGGVDGGAGLGNQPPNQ